MRLIAQFIVLYVYMDITDTYFMYRIDIILQLCGSHLPFEHVRDKTNNLGSNQVRHKPACTASEAGYKPEISDLRKREIKLSV